VGPMTITRASVLVGPVALALLLSGCGGSAPSGAPDQAMQQNMVGNGGQAAEQAVPRCVDADLEATVNEPIGAGDQQQSLLAWRNVTDRPCTMTGFGGVDLRGPDDPTFGPSYSLPRAEAQPTTVTLAPGGTGITTITTLAGGDWTPTELVVTAPDETVSKTIPWRGGTVQRQDGATHPGSFIGPVEQGSV
jgi:hypothetical protein